MDIREYNKEHNRDNIRNIQEGELISLIAKVKLKKEVKMAKVEEKVDVLELAKVNFEEAIEKLIKTECKKEGIANLDSARVFTSIPNVLKEKAEKLIAWAAEVWVSYNNHMENVKNGFMPIPTLEEVLTRLPKRGK